MLELEHLVKELRDIQLELELERKKLGILEQSREITDHMHKLCPDHGLSADRYATLMLQKIKLEKELKQKLAEIKSNPDLELKNPDDLTGLIQIDTDKTLFQEIMKSYLFLEQNAHVGKGEWELKSPMVISNIKRLEDILVLKQTDERYRLSWIESENDQVKVFSADISRNEDEITRLSGLIDEIRDWLQDRDSLIKDSNDRLEKLYRKGDNLKSAHEVRLHLGSFEKNYRKMMRN
jgi:hypothetical protein